ncbi:MAG: PD-(D/E)XK nuclease family protein [Deltaproteobacteria bacterium]|nr:PD-(D/E)XK nuclease family protein [Deltaproteobacteria bacterium]
MGLPDHTSASQLKTYSMCPRKYAFRYLDRAESEHTSPSLVLGSVVHSAVGWFFEERVGGHSPSVSDALDICHADFAAAVEGAPVRWGRWTKADLLEHAERLVRFFLQEEHDLRVAGVEERFEVELRHPTTLEPLPRPFVGYFDFRVVGGEVVELKTARSAYSGIDIASNLQFGAYAAVLEDIDAARLSVWVIVKNKRPRLQKLPVVADPDRQRWFFDAAMAIEKAILAGHFPPAPGWMCSSCEYQKQCLGPSASGSLPKAA